MRKAKRVFIDMDGVLCEYKEDATMDDMLRRGYFYNLMPRTSMLDALNYLIASGGTEVFILSAVIPSIEEQAKAEKNAWINKYLPVIDPAHRIFTLCGTEKAAAIKNFSRDDILLDDYSLNLKQWHAAGGRAVKILNEVNGKHGSFTAGPRVRISKKEDLSDIIRAI